MIYQQNCTWSLCVFDDISTNTQSHFEFLMLYQQKKANTLSACVDVVDILFTKATCLCFFCWYIIKNAKWSFTVLLIYHQQRKVSYSVICSVHDTSTKKQLATLLFLLSTKFDISSNQTIGYCVLYLHKFDNSTTQNKHHIS